MFNIIRCMFRMASGPVRSGEKKANIEMTKHLIISNAILILAIWSQGIFAADSPVVNHITLQDHETYRINSDGGYIYEDDVIDQVKTVQGIAEIGQKSIAFHNPMQRLDILYAYTETPEGKKISVGNNGIKIQESPVSLTAPIFSDIKIETIIFPKVEVGSKIHFKYRLTQLKPIFPDQFSAINFITPHSLNKDDEYSVFAPAKMKLYIDVIGYSGGKINCPNDDAGQSCYLWKTKNLAVRQPEPGSVNWLDYSPHVAITTFANYEELAAAYEARAADKSRVTPAIKALADKIVGGTKDKKKQAKLLYSWVASNIRYVAVYLGAGTVVPHSADEIVEHRYGDCKDHVALLESLLAAEGIESTGALIDASNSYKLMPVAAFNFNHIITYIPLLHRYVDSTIQFAPFGVLSTYELGKYALKVKPIAGETQLSILSQKEVPVTRIDTRTAINIDSRGSVKGTVNIINTGFGDLLNRAVFASVQPGQESRVASEILSNESEPGTGEFKHGDPRDLSKPFDYSTDFTLPHFISIPGPGAFAIPEGLGNLSDIREFADSFSVKSRRYPLAGCLDVEKRERYQIRLPKQMHVTSLPQATDVMTGTGRYQSTYTLSGHTLMVTRKLTISGVTGVCNLPQYQQLRDLSKAAGRDLRAQVLYQ